MTGLLRLSVLLSALWLSFLGLVAFSDQPWPSGQGWGQFLLLGVAPVGFVWGVWWVAQGFRRKQR